MAHTPTIDLFVPGRLCLFGEHSDWAAEFGIHRGHCLVIGTDQGLRATARACQKFVVTTPASASPSAPPAPPALQLRLPWREDALRQAAGDQGEFFRYAAGVACVMRQQHGVPGGIELAMGVMDLPLKKGVASSAAVCILVAKAFDAVYGLHLFPHELMEAAYQGEQLTASRCGRMDQACIYGKTPVLLTFEGTAPRSRVEPLFPRRSVEMLFVDLAGEKDTVGILSDLRRAYGQDATLRAALGPENERIVRDAYVALEAGDTERLGEQMTKAQRLFDARVAPHSRHLSSPLLHAVLALPGMERWITGGKGVGSQGDGTAQFVARDAAGRSAATEHIIRHFPAMRCFPLTIPARQ